MLELTIAARENHDKSIELENIIIKAINEQLAEQKGGKTEKQRYNKALKYLQNYAKDKWSKNQLHGTWELNGYQYFTNTFTGFKLKNKVVGLPQSIGLDLEGIFKGTYDNKITDIKLSLPEIKKQYTIAKANKKALNYSTITSVPEGLYRIGNVQVNIELLIDVIEILPKGDIEVYCSDNLFAPVLLKVGEDEAIILPIRPKH
jgi:hypothetical protein